MGINDFTIRSEDTGNESRTQQTQTNKWEEQSPVLIQNLIL